MTALRGSGPAPAGYVRCASPDCPSADGGSHYHPQIAPELVPQVARQRPDPRPGFYYVSAIDVDGSRKVLARGPFLAHREALAAVDATKAAVERHDPRAPGYAWGTARSDTDAGPGVLDRWEASR